MGYGNGQMALLVEDNAINAELARVLLEREGFVVKEATTAAEALRHAWQFRPDLILMDIQLPDGDGLNVVRRLREAEETRRTPIVALTAYAMTGDLDRAIGAGCDGYISKPIDTRTFGARLAEILEARDG